MQQHIEPDSFAANVDVVIAKICACPGCIRRDELDGQISYCFSFRDPLDATAKEIFFFIPHALHEDGFTVAQFEEIERTVSLVTGGFDLLPLDPNLLH